MKRYVSSVMPLLVFGLVFSAGAAFAAKEKGIKGMSQEEMISVAKSAAPPQISDNATVLIPGPDNKLTEAKKGTNGFTCIADLSGQEKPDPFCGDENATQFIMSMMNKEPRPANTAPGVGYMAQGGWHWEKDGRIVDPGTPGAKRIHEPPHWMILWPFESQATMIPTGPNKFGTYIMYDGTPYAHLMIYEDPNKLGKAAK
ncbi:MAG: hypothetical protein Q7T24_04715 [Deltaproteobacteria bacterium]|nr:hypothetical protein [Deltaproteobacteria bacterium]